MKVPASQAERLSPIAILLDVPKWRYQKSLVRVLRLRTKRTNSARRGGGKMMVIHNPIARNGQERDTYTRKATTVRAAEIIPMQIAMLTFRYLRSIGEQGKSYPQIRQATSFSSIGPLQQG